MLRIVLAALLAALPLSAQAAATLRTHTLLHSPDVLLSDLFTNAGPDAARRLGPAPAPGGRIIVEAAQLGAIARQFGVDWHPASSGDRAVLERPGRVLPRKDVLAAVQNALHAAGASAQCAVELAGFGAPLVPVAAKTHLVVSQLAYDPSAGRFTAILSVTGDSMQPINLRIAGRADDTVAVPVATARLPVGTVLTAGDVHLARVRVAALHHQVARTLAQAVGMQLRRATQPGQPLAMSALSKPVAVQRGTVVRIELHVAALSLSAQGIALQSGAAGEHIRVVNSGSRAVVDTVVVRPGVVRVLPNTVPLPAQVSSYAYQVMPR